MYRVDLAFRVEEALAGLPEEGRFEVLETIAAALVRPAGWPAPGGWAGAFVFGARSWVWFAAYPDGIDVLDVGWAG
ncbi:hypothetical protein OG824_31675 [Streptomyces prunicolor]|uniref:hypothetical protein n=1 Tax=Streptomyces prunicolor TaxID=67348 RepID=UPI002256218E|nr:hypothetical protein [Streptomyces prunicolor]MCX5239770.1 hypothetical protein [Streptomyces prunicolor]